MNRCNFDFWFDDALDCFCLNDNSNDANAMSLTNGAEDVLTDLYKIDNRIKNKPILYRDTEGIIDEMVPTFNGDKCVNVDFRFKGYSEFNEYK